MIYISGFYKFKKIDKLNNIKKKLQKYFINNSVRGTVILSAEGINGTLSAKKQKFDLVFIDADKENYKNYYDQSLDLINKNGLIIIDNVLWHGEVVDKKNQDKLTINIRELNYYVNNDKRIENLIIPIGDGLNVCRKL